MIKLNQTKVVWGIGIATVLVVAAVLVRYFTVPWPPLFFAEKFLVPKNTSQERIKQLEQAYNDVHQRPFFSFAWNSLGAAWYALGDVPRAISAFQESESLGSDAWLPRLNLARIYAQQGDRQRALDELRAAHKIRPEDGSICFEYGDMLRNYYFPEAADELGQLYVDCINAHDDANLRDRLGQLYLDLGKNKEALAVYQQLSKQDPENGRYLGKIGDIKKLLGIK